MRRSESFERPRFYLDTIPMLEIEYVPSLRLASVTISIRIALCTHLLGCGGVGGVLGGK